MRKSMYLYIDGLRNFEHQNEKLAESKDEKVKEYIINNAFRKYEALEHDLKQAIIEYMPKDLRRSDKTASIYLYRINRFNELMAMSEEEVNTAISMLDESKNA